MARLTVLALCLLAAAVCVTARPRPLATNRIAPASNCAKPNPPGFAGGWSPAKRVPRSVYGAIAAAVVESGNSTW